MRDLEFLKGLPTIEQSISTFHLDSSRNPAVLALKEWGKEIWKPNTVSGGLASLLGEWEDKEDESPA